MDFVFVFNHCNGIQAMGHEDISFSVRGDLRIGLRGLFGPAFQMIHLDFKSGIRKFMHDVKVTTNIFTMISNAIVRIIVEEN